MPQGPIRVTDITATSCQLEWKPPSNKKKPVAFYRVYIQVEGNSNSEICYREENSCRCVIDNLTPETDYKFLVEAVYDGSARSEPLPTEEIVHTKSQLHKYLHAMYITAFISKRSFLFYDSFFSHMTACENKL